METADVFRTLIEYNYTLYGRVWDSIMQLTEAQFGQNIDYSHGSIRDQMMHVYDPAFIEAQVQFNWWFKENAGQTNPPLDLLDTTGVAMDETAAQVVGWIRARTAGVADA